MDEKIKTILRVLLGTATGVHSLFARYNWWGFIVAIADSG
jgi:hypothetical protein